ncbi:MAG: hypothetical protein R3A51_19820 [Nannocystaceae bacterium]
MSSLPTVPATAPEETPLGALAMPGKILELSGAGASACVTTAAAILRETQRAGETAAWLQCEDGDLFPPDLAEAGVELEELIVIHVPKTRRRALELVRAGELLLSSGAFGLLIIDFGRFCPRDQRSSWQLRLARLARQHGSRVVILTQKPDHHHSAGPLVHLRVAPTRARRREGGFEVIPRVLKHKAGLQRVGAERHRAPAGHH